MSEYRYYEFQALDRPLGEADREALRALSTRARITATSFANRYDFGDFKGDPLRLVERWFDLHLHLADWGTRRLTIRLPKRLVDRARLDAFLPGGGLAEVVESGDNLILDIRDDGEDDGGEPEGYDEGWDDGSGWLDALAPLRGDLLSGDWRLPYLVWLRAVDRDRLRDEAREPLPGIGPLTGGLEAFAAFFRIDPDLVEAAAEAPGGGEPPPEAVAAAVAAIPEADRTALLRRLAEGDPHVAAEVRSRVRETAAAADADLRTVSDLRARAAAVRGAREAAEAERRRAARERREREAEQARRARLDALRRRGDGAWREVESEIGRRNAAGYDRAAALLADLGTLAGENGATADFARRLDALRSRHRRKERLLERLAGLDPA